MTETETRPPRLNPFAFASDTTLRFVLLVVLIACASGRLWVSTAWDLLDLAPRLRSCLGGEPWLSGTLLHLNESRHEAVLCVSSVVRAGVLPSVPVGLALLAGTTWLILRAYPHWQVRRLGLEHLDPQVAPELSTALDLLCRTAGLQRNPEFWWNPLDRRPLALAFGIGKRRVALTGAIALQLYTDPQTFRVVVHELAHIRNGDVGLAYLTFSIWWAFLATAVLPYAATTPYVAIVRGQPQYVSELVLAAAQLGLITLCVLPARNAVLRARAVCRRAQLCLASRHGGIGWSARRTRFYPPTRVASYRRTRRRPGGSG